MSIEAMKQALEALESSRQTHHYCEDTWYSCPKHEEGCANEAEGDECNCGADEANALIDTAITSLRQAIEVAEQQAEAEKQENPTYTSTQATDCAGCGEHKHTPLRIDAMGGYVCLTCIDHKLGSLLGEFGYPEAEKQEPVGINGLTEAETNATASVMGLVNKQEPVAWYHPEDFKTHFTTEPSQDMVENGYWQPLYKKGAL